MVAWVPVAARQICQEVFAASAMSTDSAVGSVVPRATLTVAGEDVADVRVGAVGRVEVVAACHEVFQLLFEGGELGLAGADGVELGVQDGRHVGAGSVAVVSEVDDAAYLDQGQACRLGVADELDAGDGRIVVGTVAVGLTARLG